ncbi:MAG: HAD family hydrolase [Alphaproteobacteria bacterium]|nr:MAG: HAD family hydrolase [Alphaproteobacteria bacterium]
MTLEAIIFDVDGTLAETEEIHRRAFNETFAAAGLSWHWDQPTYRELLKTTGGKERMRAFIHDYHPADAPEEADIPRIHAAKTARYGELIAEGAVELRPGIAELIADARAQGMPVAIATTTSRPNVDALCQAAFGAPAEAIFAAVAAGDEVPRKKPAPDVYLLALERLGLPARACVALEDSRNGLLSAVAAGIACVVSPGPYTRGQDFAEACAVVDEFSEVDGVTSLTAIIGATV